MSAPKEVSYPVTNEHLTVVASDVTLAFPDAKGYDFDKYDNLIVNGEDGQMLALIARSDWDRIYMAGTKHLMLDVEDEDEN